MPTRWGLRLVLAAATCTLALGAHAVDEQVVDVPQGWSPAQKSTWYTLSQGSRLIPKTWLEALEQSDTSRPFLLREHSERFRYLLNASPDPAPLPLGFAVDVQSDELFSKITRLRWKNPQSSREPWVGMNCAACHTNEVTFQGKRLRIEGAPTLADFQGYMKSLNLALVATRDDQEKWGRFAAKVLVGADSASNRKLLRGSLESLAAWQLRVEQANHTELAYGFARLDAFGHIFNKVLLRTQASNQPTNPSDAPVSYPFLWNIHQHDKVQWNGIAANFPIGDTLDLGALGRNIGEVTGVFADLTLLPFGPAAAGYRTSARVKNLMQLEQQIATLEPPAWPQAFPPIDADKWEAGKALFHRQPNACVKCHEVLPREDLSSRITARMARLSGPDAIGTDPWMACNAFTYQARSGRLQLTPQKFFAVPGRVHGETEPVAELLETAVIGSIWYRGAELVQAIPLLRPSDIRAALLDQRIFDRSKLLPVADVGWIGEILAASNLPADKASRLRRCMEQSKASETLAYKGRPLGGIWATPPYLHNGSVPSLFDLLLPPSARPKTFQIGTREFDPQRVGFVTGQSSPAYLTESAKTDNQFVFRSVDALGQPIAGNSNLGHDYGNAALSDDERWALVEYMKAVGARRVGNQVVP